MFKFVFHGSKRLFSSTTWSLLRVIIILTIVLQGVVGSVVSVQAAQPSGPIANGLFQIGQAIVTLTAGNCLNSDVAHYTITQRGNIIAQGTMLGTPPEATVALSSIYRGQVTVEIRCGALPANAQINCLADQSPGIVFSGFTFTERWVVCNAVKAVAAQVGGEANFLNLARDAARVVCENNGDSPEACPPDGQDFHITYEKRTEDGASSWEGRLRAKPFIKLGIFAPQIYSAVPPFYEDELKGYLPPRWQNSVNYAYTVVEHETSHALQTVRPDIVENYSALDSEVYYLFYPNGNKLDFVCNPPGGDPHVDPSFWLPPSYEVEAQAMALLFEYGRGAGVTITDLSDESQKHTITDFLRGGNSSCPERSMDSNLIDIVQGVFKSLQPAVFDVQIQLNGCIHPFGLPAGTSIVFDCDVPQSKIDVVITMDTTGSMGSSIQGLKNAMTNFVGALVNARADYRVAVVDFKDKSYPPFYASRLDRDFTTNLPDIFSAINNLQAIGGGDLPEDVYSGLMRAINLQWRDGAKKVIVLIGDAPPHDPESGTYDPVSRTRYTASSVIAAANAVDPANIYAVRVGTYPAMRSAFQQLADGTGGRVFDTDYNSLNVTAALLNAVNVIASFPSAVVGVLNDPISGAAWTPILFEGGHSIDPNGYIVRYEWDFNNDGIFDINTSAPSVDYAYPGAYSGWVVLRVTDNDGNQSNVKVQATVSAVSTDTTPPVITVASPLAQSYLHTDSLNIAWTATDTGSGIFSSSAVLDGAPVTNGESVDLFFLGLGSHTLTVSATDKAGNSANKSVVFTVTANIDSLIAAEQRACALGWIDGPGVCNSLEAKLRAARASIEKGKFNTARNQLNAFINELDAQNGKKVTQGYDVLKDDTTYVINHLP